MLLKELPDIVDPNPVKLASNIVKSVLKIQSVRHCSSHQCLTDYAYQEVKGNIDTVERRILSTATQLDEVEKALAGWMANDAEEKQGFEQFKTYTCLSPPCSN